MSSSGQPLARRARRPGRCPPLAGALAAAALFAALPAAAQDAGTGEGKGTGQQGQDDTSQGTGPLPAPNVAPSPTPICTDRPTKASVACTVPAGDVQIETDVLNWTRQSIGGTRTDTVLYTDPFVKLGIGTHTDVEAGIAPYETVRTRTPDGAVSTLGGVGDLTVRVKQRLTGDGARTQVAIIPYVIAPTAKAGIGDGDWEGGAILVANVPLPAGFTFTVGPEVDVLADGEGGGHHAGLVMLTNISHGVGKKVTVYGELWTQQDLDPSGHVARYSFDTAMTYQVAKGWQADLGANLGLNRATPGSQLYLGLSTRF